MAVYNVDKIDNWYNDFVTLKNKFSNTYYSNYKSSYVKSCYDSAVNKMESNLNKHYLKIEKLYNNINNVWREYLTDLKNVDKRLAGGKGSINAGIVSSKLSKLPVLKEYKRDLSIRIKSVSGVVGTAKVVGWSEDRSIKENFGYVFGDALEKTGATIATAAVSLVEGVAKLGEDFVDLFAFASAGIATVFTYADPNSSYEEKKQMVESIWEDTRSFVSVNYVQSAFDSFYEKTAAGNWMKQNAYGFDTIREIGTEIGEVVGVVALSAITGGSAAVMYGAAKTAEHTEENWQDENTSTFKGLAKGALQGIGDGIFFSIGMKGDKIAQTAAKKAVESGGKTFLKKSAILGAKMMFEGGTSVAQDSSSILLDTLFSDNKIVDQNGQVITFTNFSDKWEYYYEQAGGTQALVQSMGTAAVLSFFSDRSDIYGIKNSSSAMKNADVDLNADQIGKSTRDINIKNMNSNSKVYSDVEISGLKKEYDDLINWRSSDKFLTDEAYYQAHGDKIGGNPYKKNMDRIAELEEILKNNRDYGVTDITDAVKEGKENSLTKFIDENGKLTPEREQVHKQIIDELLKEKVGVEGRAELRMLGGGPASGKSSVTKEGLVEVFDEHHSLTIDPDKIKEKLPGYNEMAKTSEHAAAFYHEESSALAKRLSSVAYSENLNITYDGTGSSEKSVLKKIELARKNGYKVTGLYVTIDTDEAVRRNMKRYIDAKSKGECPRLVPEEFVKKCHSDVTKTALSIANEFDEFRLYDNNGPKGSCKLIATGGAGKKLSSIEGEEEAFARFVAKQIK